MYDKNPVETTDNGKSVKYFYYIDIEKAIDSSCDKIDSIISVPENKIITSNFGKNIELDLSSREMEFKNKKFPLNIIFTSTSDWYSGYLNYYNQNSVIKAQYEEFEKNILKPVNKYLISIMTLKKETELEAVCKVFENVNTGGITLTSFELVTAMFARYGFKLRDDWEKIKAENFSDGIFKANDAKKEILSSTDFLTTCRIFAGYKSGKYKVKTKYKRNEVLNLTLDDYEKYKKIVINGFMEAQKFLQEERIFVPENLPYTTQLIPLAIICAIFSEDGNINTDFVREKIRKWFWCGIFGEIYKGGANYGRFVNDIVDMQNWIKNETALPKTINAAQFNPLDLKKLKSRNSAAFKGFIALILKNGSKDFINGRGMDFQSYENEKIDMHHIFPQKICKKENYNSEKWKSIINQTPISSDSNKFIGGNYPKDYLKKILNERKVSSRQKLECVHTKESTIIANKINPEYKISNLS